MVAQLAIDATCNQSMAAIVPRAGMEPRFLLWWLAANYETIRNLAGGELRDGLNLEIVGDIRCPLLPPALQATISRYLDRETARLDALIAVTQQMLRLLTERWETQRIALVSGTSGNAEHLSEGPEWLGRVPSGWPIERLKFLARMESGHTPDRKVAAYWVDCTIPWITLNDVGALQREWTITESANAINELGMANSAAHLLPAGTVVLSRDATVGRAAILGRPMTVSQHFVGWICGPRLAPEYLLHVLRGPMQRHFATLTAGATIATIGMPELSELVMPVPTLDEQARIVTELRFAEDQLERVRVALEKRVALLQERRQSLVTAAVTGELEIPEAA
jgi:type I restriction enzyme S subunit